ncbi:PAT family beta-lactamase induction signal transducer AmpG [Hephaestia caeni]|uniref:PAT family beta-lactamase induction signal transducer AmpG n=1 Tax=Hephaestia caeni TaxID=645617 RepID=A0A397NJY8_9SPHN|nr:MFS transporter [Hephaestia caeni]RIA36648.1 PAT family beta-lactamase induction signal transducer AmpG [Hephaestia caeni]
MGDSGGLKGWKLLRAAFTNRKIGVMFALGFGSGLPYALLLGTLYAWLSDAEVDLETMGVFSLIGLAYAFKFLWSPVVDRVRLPLIGGIGRRKGWLIPAQGLLGVILIALSLFDPARSLGWFSALAGLGAFASATQDIATDAWRVDQADDIATLDILSTVYQLGYRIAALAGGALALVLAARIGWPAVYAVMGCALLAVMAITCFAPDSDQQNIVEDEHELRRAGELSPQVRGGALVIVGTLWAWSIFMVIVFMVRSLGAAPADRPDPTAFVAFYGPVIVFATVILPAIIAAVLQSWKRKGRHVIDRPAPAANRWNRIVDHGYSTLILPLADLIDRLRWGAILVLALILTYRITDSIWGTFAYPFYLGFLDYTNDQVAIASKFFGVGMTMAGIAMSALFFSWIGRMATVVLGAVVAAISNLLYADLANGGAGLDVFGHTTGLYWLFAQFGSDDRMSRLLLAISGENIAGGLAGAAFVAYLSSIASKRYSAVQYALLSSLTFLVGSLGRGALGKAIEVHGYAWVFYLTAGLGCSAIVLAALEWWRERRRVGEA